MSYYFPLLNILHQKRDYETKNILHNVLFLKLLLALYLCGLCKCVLCGFGDGAKVSAIDNSKTGHRRNNQQHKAGETWGDVELEEERE